MTNFSFYSTFVICCCYSSCCVVSNMMMRTIFSSLQYFFFYMCFEGKRGKFFININNITTQNHDESQNEILSWQRRRTRQKKIMMRVVHNATLATMLWGVCLNWILLIFLSQYGKQKKTEKLLLMEYKFGLKGKFFINSLIFRTWKVIKNSN